MNALNNGVPPSKNVIVIGGTGETGRRILRALHRRCPHVRLSCAARRPDRSDTLPAGVSRVALDIDDSQSAVAVLRQFDLAIIALGPMDAYGARPHTLCLQAGIDCVDVNDSLSAADAIQALNSSALAQGRRVLTGMGLTPGLSGILLMKLVREQASASGTYRSRFYAGAAYGGGETSPYVLLDSFKPTLTAFIDGKRQTQPAPWGDAHSRFTFSGHATPAPLIAYSAPEIATLGAHDSSQTTHTINTLDYRYSIQFLSPRSARLMGRLSRWKGVRERLAKMFYSSGQSMKKRKKADPDCCLWVYPDNRPEDGWVVHGCISSYDFTALTACAAVQWLLAESGEIGAGVYSMEQLPASAHHAMETILRRHGISARRAKDLDPAMDPLQFGWCQVVSGSSHELPHFGQCWYDAAMHPRMPALQTTYLTDSAVWARLREKKPGLAMGGFVASFLWRWREHHRRLASFRSRHPTYAAEWAKITRDISMFTAGYSRVRDLLGQQQAYALYREMFLATGKMEMRWLWPVPEVIAATDDPSGAVRSYWQAFMARYQTLGLLRGQRTENGYRIDHCTFAEMFTLLGSPELNTLMREMEHEALAYMARLTTLEIDWQSAADGCATVSLNAPAAAALPAHTTTTQAASL
ncbi:saccharopine dehydrogenase NADP-binding domain-containing protein [Pseudomonas cremoricolorata]|uniref:saccharopine dehydrogenase NADP-binding domain-containing protein n=1 Tax=Pseudomonas cremoricolorata TaxID=157783 RepID=UPI0004139E48|nr:saccharopine dehydrogenase NADP-binding domain-containing protein [Pseudomonas cremoricolorata]